MPDKSGEPMDAILAVDPGREKCGLAVCTPSGVLARGIFRITEIENAVTQWVREYRVERIVLGDRTGSGEVQRRLQEAGVDVPVILVPEHATTLKARLRYFQDHPPRGWRRLLPLSLQTPPEPYDDYAAVVLAEEFFRKIPGGEEKFLGR